MPPADARRSRFLVGAFALSLCIALHASADEQLAAAIANAVKLAHVYPDVPNDIDEQQAYAIQAAVVKDLYGGAIAGYKAGLTSVATQQRFHVNQPVIGALPVSGKLSSGVVLATVHGLKIEVEIGFVVGEGARPTAMLPVIELPRLDYVDMKEVALADIVATNVSAYQFIAGAASPTDADARALEVSLDKDGKELFAARGSDALGDPLQSYAWTIGKIRSLGYELKPGMIVITGALGRVIDADPGNYVARYGALGELQFRIEANDDALQAAR